jgi:membrane protein YqaA with SNARE-associated domain
MFDFSFTAEWGLAGLFVASFLAATLLPGGSEAALFALVRVYPDHALPALGLATLGNTLGGLSSYALGRLMRLPVIPSKIDSLRRYGSPALVLSWVPIVGDALCLAAGWLRLNSLYCLGWMALGKGLRYVAVLEAGRFF